jgi:serine/threonine protein phosphatase 1
MALEAGQIARGLTFAVADLHGRRDLLDRGLAAIAAYADKGRVIFLGDYIDRGPQSADVLARLMEGPEPGWRWTCLKGNHEAMMSLALRQPDRLDWWLENGGDATIRSYGARQDLIAAHLRWVDALPCIEVDPQRVYVHAGVDPWIPLSAQAERTLLWKRYPAGTDEGYGERHLVHGHDPAVDGPRCFPHRTALDTLAWKTGRLVIGVFADEAPGGPVDLIEIAAAPQDEA